jgi:hypothetical protein
MEGALLLSSDPRINDPLCRRFSAQPIGRAVREEQNRIWFALRCNAADRPGLQFIQIRPTQHSTTLLRGLRMESHSDC